MELTEEQKTEIKDYIITVPKYRETYNELYDHILNSLADQEGTFHINEVLKIVNDDFGGFKEIVEQEKIYHKEIGKKYNKYFRLQFFNILKGQGIAVLAFCVLIYYSSKTTFFNLKPMLVATIICCVFVAILGYSKIFFNRIKYSKYSILDSYLMMESSFGLAITNIFLYVFINGNFFDLSYDSKLIVMLALHFFCTIYVRTFMKIYNQKFKILTT